MSTLMIRDLAESRELDRKAMSGIRGGSNSWLSGLGPVANVNVGVNQNIAQIQNIGVNVLNNVGSIGAGFVPPDLAVSPEQWAATHATI